jgi:hypothetical protein
LRKKRSIDALAHAALRSTSILRPAAKGTAYVEPMTESDIVGRFRQTLLDYQQGPLAYYLPYTNRTEPTLERLAALKPRILATMHGSTFVGDGTRAIHDLAQVMEEILGQPAIS